MRIVLSRLMLLALAASALAACDQDTYSSNPEDRRTHMGDDIKAQGAPVPAPTAPPPPAAAPATPH